MDTPHEGEERRAEDRIPVRIEVHFRDAAAAAEALRSYAVNFSVGGICLKTERSYPVGHALQLVLLVEEERFELEGVVAWARGREQAIGVRFREVETAARERLGALVHRLGPTTLPGAWTLKAPG
ncbi:MAG TPA: PilZ domain-containing protein [Myxococcaceae bacterium]|nr:PilZ domain-containing protein [Myxococcaceae bacterium]